MIEVDQDVWIGDQNDFESNVKFLQGWAVVHACKEPYHRNALGYVTRGAPKQHPEYYFAIRLQELCLNLVDVPDPNYIQPQIIDFTLSFIIEQLRAGRKVLIHCNQGLSRSPGIGMLFLAQKGDFCGLTYDDAKLKFLERYPHFSPAAGIEGYCRINWDKYRK
jgi:hypothetical protein